MKFLIFLFLCGATCLEFVFAAEVQKAHVASIKRNTTTLHKCNAFFVTEAGEKRVTESRTLITTASCVFRSDHHFTVVVGDKIIGEQEFYNIEEIIIHPKYNNNPEQYNIAVVHIDKPAKDVLIYELVNTTYYYGLTGFLYLWRFVDTVYELTENNVVYVTEDLYERATNSKLREGELAIMSHTPITNGHYDMGTPFTMKFSEDEEDLKKDHNYVLGFLVKPYLRRKAKFFVLYSIPFYYSWITSHLK